jgi:hypothetical protein
MNDKVSCSSIQYYGLSPGTIVTDKLAGHHSDTHGVKKQFISHSAACEDYGRIEKGDVLWIEAFYNGTKYPQMEANGRLENVSNDNTRITARNVKCYGVQSRFPLNRANLYAIASKWELVFSISDEMKAHSRTSCFLIRDRMKCLWK